MFGKLVSSIFQLWSMLQHNTCISLFGGLFVNISVPNPNSQAIARIPLGPESRAVISFGLKNQKTHSPPKPKSLLQIPSGIVAFDGNRFLFPPKKTTRETYYSSFQASRWRKFPGTNLYKPKYI